MVAPIVARGALPAFYPLDSHGAPNLDWIRQQDIQHVRVVLVAHFFGLPQSIAGIRQWCDQKNIRLIEDCAHALFGRADDRAIGCWGDLAIASLTKFLPVPEGGCLVNNMSTLATPMLDRVKPMSQIRAAFDIIHNSANHGRLTRLGELTRGFHGFLGKLRNKPSVQHLDESAPAAGFAIDVVQSHRALTYASRWMALHAPRARIVARRREHYIFFAKELSGLAGLHPIRSSLPEDCAPYVFPVWVDYPDPGYAELRRLQFPVSRWDILWPNVPVLDNDFGTLWSRHILQLACHQDLTRAELQQMVDTMKQIYAPTRNVQ